MTEGVAYTPKELEEKKTEIVSLLRDGLGLPFYGACKKAGIPVATVYDWRAKDEAFDKDVIAARKMGYDNALDYTENKLMQLIEKGDGRSVRFFLETKGKRRDYTKRTEITGKDGVPLHAGDAPVVKATDEEALAAASETLRRPAE